MLGEKKTDLQETATKCAYCGADLKDRGDGLECPRCKENPVIHTQGIVIVSDKFIRDRV